MPGTYARFYKRLLGYLDGLPEDKKLDLLYTSLVSEQDDQIARIISRIVNDLNLFDCQRCMKLLEHNDFKIRKRAVTILAFDKTFYNKDDIKHLTLFRDNLQTAFPEIGKRSTKKGLLSSKEKDIGYVNVARQMTSTRFALHAKQIFRDFQKKKLNLRMPTGTWQTLYN